MSGSFFRDVGRTESSRAHFVLDGRELMKSGYSGKPVDYWGRDWRKQNPDHFESEDRIYSSSPTIPASPFIINVVLFISKEWIDIGKQSGNGLNETRFAEYKAVLEIYKLCKRNNIELIIYDDPKAYTNSNKSKQLQKPISLLKDIYSLLNKTNKDELFYYSSLPFDSFDPFLYLISAPVGNKIPYNIKTILNDIFWYNDQADRLSRMIAANSKPSNEGYNDCTKLINLMIKLNLRTPDEVIKFIKDRWKDHR